MGKLDEQSSVNDLLDFVAVDSEWVAEVLRDRVKLKNMAISQQAETMVDLRRQLAELEQKCEKYHAGKVEMKIKIADLVAENERLENLLAEGVHSCSKTCKRPMCVLRREKAELEQQLAALTDDLDAQLAQAMSVVKDREQQLAEMRREYDSLMDENISVAERNLILTSKLTALKEQDKCSSR